MFLTFTKKVLSVKEPTYKNLSPLRFVYCRCHWAWPPEDVQRERERGKEKCCEQQLRNVEKALARAGDIPEPRDRDLSKPQKFIAMIILHFHLHPQFKYELFHIYFTSEIWYLPRTNAVPVHLRGNTVKCCQNVRSLRGCMRYLMRWVGTALPNTSLGKTGVLTNAASSQLKNSHPTRCSLPGIKNSDIRK